jgi:hypothetical protein
MRRLRLSLCLAVVVSAISFSGAHALTWPACAVGTSVHPLAKVLLNHKVIATCAAGSYGCKCVSCYNLDGSVSAACYALVAPMPH